MNGGGIASFGYFVLVPLGSGDGLWWVSFVRKAARNYLVSEVEY